MISGANENDGHFIIPMIDAIPPIRGLVGAPRSRPDAAVADKAYTWLSNIIGLAERHITALLPARGTDEDRGLGKIRWGVERSLSWLHQFRRLRVRYERRADIHLAFFILGCVQIALRSF